MASRSTRYSICGVVCEGCSELVSSDWKFCTNCGLRINDPEREIIEQYFHLGYKYTAIVNLLKNRHNISMNLRTLKRRLAKYNLSKKNNETDEEELKNIIKEEMQGCGSQSGYRKMWHVLRIKHHIHVPRTLVAKVLKDLDPEASSLRKRKKLKRRQYLSHGPNQCWHIDGYDKLKPYGFPIHSGLDGFSRKVLWLEVARSNNDPERTAKFYLESVKQHKICPLQTRTDYGTENGITAAMQCYFRSDDNAPFSGEDAHVYGTSTRNQRIENFWSHFRKSCSNWWIQFFKDLVDSGQVDIANEIHKECLWFCFHGIIQEALDEMKQYWNTHYIRPSRHETVGGVPNILFHLPEQSGAFDCGIAVCKEKLLEMEEKCNNELEDNVYHEYFHYIVDKEELHYPSNHSEALSLFHHLINSF